MKLVTEEYAEGGEILERTKTVLSKDKTISSI